MQASSNDAALALIQSGQVDWTHNFVPNVAKAYVSKDPQHYHAFYATTAYPMSLTFDDTKYPYSLVAFRKALSLAIDRDSVSKLGEYGYAPPTDAIGLSGFSRSGSVAPCQGAGEGGGQVQPRCCENDAHGRRLHVQRRPARRSEGQPRLSSTST